MTAATITVPAYIVAAVAAGLSPGAVALLVHFKASVRTKRLVGATITALLAFVTQRTTADGDAVITTDAIITTIVGGLTLYAIQQGSYTAILKRLGLNTWRITAPTKGIGKPPPS